MTPQNLHPLFAPLRLPCGMTLKNRIIRAAMPDSLGDGTGNPTIAQMRLYERWAMGGCAAAMIGGGLPYLRAFALVFATPCEYGLA